MSLNIYLDLCKKYQVKPEDQYFAQLKCYDLVLTVRQLTLEAPNPVLFCELLKQLSVKKLYISKCPLGKDFTSFLAALKTQRELEEISLVECGFSPQQSFLILTQLAQFQRLRLVDLSRGQLDLKQACKLKLPIQTLVLRACTLLNPSNFSDWFENLTNLRHLDLAGSNLRQMVNFTEFILKYFNLQPETLNLNYCFVGKNEIKEVLQMLQVTKTVTGLFVDGLNLIEEQQLQKTLLRNYDLVMEKGAGQPEDEEIDDVQ